MEKNFDKIWHAFLINPAAGPENCEREIRKGVRDFFGHQKTNRVTFFLSRHKGDVEKEIRELHRRVIGENFDELLIYACGGDGMLSEVVNGVMRLENRDRIAITHIPKGFENDFIRNFSNPSAFSDIGLFGNRKNTQEFFVDVFKVNDRFCINSCSFGLDARIENGVQELRKKKNRSEKIVYPASLSIEMLKDIKRHMIISICDSEGKTLRIEGDFAMACFCNGGWVEGELHPIPQARINDGAVDLLIVRETGKLKALSLLRHCRDGGCERFTKDFVEKYHIVHAKVITNELEPVCIDGEIYMYGDTTIDVVPKALKFFTPKNTWIH